MINSRFLSLSSFSSLSTSPFAPCFLFILLPTSSHPPPTSTRRFRFTPFRLLPHGTLSLYQSAPPAPLLSHYPPSTMSSSRFFNMVLLLPYSPLTYNFVSPFLLSDSFCYPILLIVLLYSSALLFFILLRDALFFFSLSSSLLISHSPSSYSIDSTFSF